MSAIATIEREQDIVRIHELRGYVQGALDLIEVQQVADRAGKLREWLRVTKAATEARKAAVELECTALRRLAQLWDGAVAPEGIHSSTWKAARAFATLDDDEFERMLATIKQASTPGTLFSQLRARFEHEERQRRRREGYESFVQTIHVEDEEAEIREAYSLRKAATTLIESLSLDGRAFSVAGAAVDLAEKLNADENMSAVADWDADELQSVLREVVRDAISQAPDEESGEFDLPQIITYVDGELGNVRIPWHSANLSHFLAMTALRRRQADEAVAVAERFEKVADQLSARLRDDQDLSAPLSELVRQDLPRKKVA